MHFWEVKGGAPLQCCKGEMWLWVCALLRLASTCFGTHNRTAVAAAATIVQDLAGGGIVAEEEGESVPSGGSEVAATGGGQGFRIHYMTMGPVEGFG